MFTVYIYNIHSSSDLLETYVMYFHPQEGLNPKKVMPAENAETREARLATDFLADMTDAEGHRGHWRVEVANARMAEKNTPQQTSLKGNQVICSISIPCRELTYPTWGKGKSSSKVPFYGIC